MRTSTGSISVMKMTQNAVLRNGKLKYTTAKADRIEIRILPIAMPMAMMKRVHHHHADRLARERAAGRTGRA